ncbi:unnamed protein product [Prorocentrum cordatum]|uniref:Uncharacterized protein n=1 Tax=Prorocentrum cordatum TaxID=2364126 RepID=A0ABN9SS73_9DINO|nr:unnamed protein product [Polarella glacialis]
MRRLLRCSADRLAHLRRLGEHSHLGAGRFCGPPPPRSRSARAACPERLGRGGSRPNILPFAARREEEEEEEEEGEEEEEEEEEERSGGDGARPARRHSCSLQAPMLRIRRNRARQGGGRGLYTGLLGSAWTAPARAKASAEVRGRGERRKRRGEREAAAAWYSSRASENCLRQPKKSNGRNELALVLWGVVPQNLPVYRLLQRN